MNTWYTIHNNLDAAGVTEIYIDNEIGDFGIPARMFLNELKAAGSGPIRLHINSPGGSLIDAFAIYDFIKLKGYKLNAYIHGIAASAATIISSAAQETFIGEHSYFFIHNPYFSKAKHGPKGDLKKMKNDILDIYMKKTGLDRQRLSDMMDKETLLNASEALEMGFVDGIAGEAKVAALKHRQECLEKLTAVSGKNLVLESEIEVDKTEGKLLTNIWAKLGEIDQKVKKALRGTDASRLDFIDLKTVDGKNLFILPTDTSRTIMKPGDAAYSNIESKKPLTDGAYPLADGRRIQIKHGIINFIINQKPMQNTQELQSQLEALVQQLSDLLQQYFTQDNAEDANDNSEDPVVADLNAQNSLKAKDETIRNLKQELSRFKAKRLENRNNPADSGPDGAETARSKGWNYVSSYLQNHSR